MEYVKLNNGVKMPILGYGVYQTPPEETERCVLEALETGYRSIDTAQAFITTKVWISNAGYEKAKESIEESLRKLQTDYVDLLLIHQPFGDYYGTYRAMEEAYKEGKARALGVSNFYPDRYLDLFHFAEIKPAVNQVETHVFQQQKTARKYMEKYGTQVMSWGPFAEGKNDYFQNPVLKEIGDKHGKSVAQTALRFLIQNGVIVIPKSVHKSRMEENFNVFDFTLTEEEMKRIEALDTGESLFFSHYDPETVEWFMSLL